jgi:hypothetical protein
MFCEACRRLGYSGAKDGGFLLDSGFILKKKEAIFSDSLFGNLQ